MSMNDPLGDMLTRIRNGQSSLKSEIVAPFSVLRAGVLEVLKREGYIRGYEKVSEGNKDSLKVELKYYEGNPVIKKIARVSTPGRRVYKKINSLPKVYNGLGISVLSTSRGIMSDNDARQENVGGEVLCTVF